MHDAVEDGIGQRRIVEPLVPRSDRQLAGGELRRLGFRDLTVGDGDLALVEVQSYNCSLEFAKARLMA